VKLRRVRVNFITIPESEQLFKTKRIQNIIARALLRDKEEKKQDRTSKGNEKVILTKVAN